jgi:hypothetical protein
MRRGIGIGIYRGIGIGMRIGPFIIILPSLIVGIV